jgi:hypothetical protein
LENYGKTYLAGIIKSFGPSSLAVFQILFSLVFEGRNWFRLLESERGTSLPGKDVIYRFSSAKLVNRICEMKEYLCKCSHGYKRRLEALTRKPDAVVNLLQRALSAGFIADFVLMDSWFTQAPLLRQLNAMGLPVIGMIKEMKQRYRLNGKLMTLKELYATLPKNKSNEILGSIIAETSCGLPVKLVFVQNRNKRRDWLAILSTDLTVSADEVVRVYGMRWSIETFFKFTKSYLKLGTEFQGRIHLIFLLTKRYPNVRIYLSYA